MLHGLDCSNHQDGIDLSKLPPLDFIIFKGSQGTKYPDRCLDQFMAQAMKLGITRLGIYWWLESHEPVQAQLDVFLAKVRPYLDLPELILVVDWEPKDPSRVDICTEGVRLLKQATGKPVHVYMNYSTANKYAWKPVRDLGCKLWLAQYASNNRVDGFQANPWYQAPSGWESSLMGLQYTDQGRLPGYGSRLDLNVFWSWDAPKPTPTTTEQKGLAPVNIPAIRESDPKVWIQLPGGNAGWGCICMKLTLPLVEADLKRAGIIKNNLDVFQWGYNAGGVAASAGTHDMGGVIDVAQGTTKQEREIWAKWGWMMAPRTRGWGWTGGDHGHGGMYGCVHRTGSLAKQVRDMMAGRNGLVSNTYVDWVKPSRTWQEAVASHYAATPVAIPAPPVVPTSVKDDSVPEIIEHATSIDHRGNSDWAYVPTPVFVPKNGQTRYNVTAVVNGPADAKLKLRFVAWHQDHWFRYPEVEFSTGSAALSFPSWTHTGGIPVHIDVWSDSPGVHEVFFTGHLWQV